MLVADFKRCASVSAGCCEEAETAAETMAALAASAPASACLELAAAAAAPLETASTGLLVDLLVDPRGLAARFFSALLALGFLDAPPPPPRGLAAPAELEATAQLPADLGVLRPVVARGVVLPEPRAVERPDVLGEEALLIGGTDGFILSSCARTVLQAHCDQTRKQADIFGTTSAAEKFMFLYPVPISPSPSGATEYGNFLPYIRCFLAHSPLGLH